MIETSWHTLSKDRVVQMFKTDADTGLTVDEAKKRHAEYGLNMFTETDRQTFGGRFVGQLKNPLVLILLLAGVAMAALTEYVDATVIGVALAVNIAIGLFQETRASRAFEKLASSQEQFATVVRGGARRVIAARELVPGDVVVLRAGASVPADAYLLEARGLETGEAVLTGESVSVSKDVTVCEADVPITSRRNMVWMGTLIVSGEGLGVVVDTGDSTEIGHIAESLTGTDETHTPIQKNIRRLARLLSALIVSIVVVIFVLGLARGEDIETMLLLAIAVAVSVIPEGLPAAVTAVLAIGMERILSHGGLVRNLLAAETLGSTTVILTDKTGTLTKAEMQLAHIITRESGSEVGLSDDAQRALAVALRASDAFVEASSDTEAVVRGRPIERAIVERARRERLLEDGVLREEARKDFLPFDSQNRFAASLNEHGDHRVLYVSGAPGMLLGVATRVLHGGVEMPITQSDKEFFSKQFEAYARQGIRFIAVGYKETFMVGIPDIDTGRSAENVLEGLVFVALLGFEDPIREDVPHAVGKVQGAGARVLMLTGDNPETARSIALQAGVASADATVLRGSAVEKMNDDELRTQMNRVRVFARMLPEQKLRIVKLLQKDGEVVAMTGDGVNDAPALKRADIGVAVGSGTEVAKEASDLILLNNSFAIIVAAIEEGRRIIDNLKKVITHLLSTSFHEVFIIAGSIVFGLPLPVLPVQILWVNILQEGFLNFGFAFEPAERDVMKRDPQEAHVRTILTGEIRKLIFIAGIITGIFSFVLYLALLQVNVPIDEIRTFMFVVLLLDALFFAVSLKNLRGPFWRANLLNNHYLLFALSVSVIGLIVTLSVPSLRSFLSLAVLTPQEIFILVGVGLFNLLTIEVSKYVVFRNKST